MYTTRYLRQKGVETGRFSVQLRKGNLESCTVRCLNAKPVVRNPQEKLGYKVELKGPGLVILGLRFRRCWDYPIRGHIAVSFKTFFSHASRVPNILFCCRYVLKDVGFIY